MYRALYKDVVKNFDLAVDYVRRHDGHQLFFLFVATFVTHGPHEVTTQKFAKWMKAHNCDNPGLAQMMLTVE